MLRFSGLPPRAREGRVSSDLKYGTSVLMPQFKMLVDKYCTQGEQSKCGKVKEYVITKKSIELKSI